MLKLQSFAGTF